MGCSGPSECGERIRVWLRRGPYEASTKGSPLGLGYCLGLDWYLRRDWHHGRRNDTASRAAAVGNSCERERLGCGRTKWCGADRSRRHRSRWCDIARLEHPTLSRQWRCGHPSTWAHRQSCRHVGQCELLLRHGFAVLLPDARPHGISGGDIATYGVMES